jgi:hypothetical protein
MTIALIVPVLKRFDLFTYMIKTVDCEIKPYVIPNYEFNMGVSAAWNEGMRQALSDGYEYAIITNDDVRFDKNCIKQIEKSLKETDAVIVCANQNAIHNFKNKLIEGADFFCFGVNISKLINHCGFFDENFYPAYFEDNDMEYRIKLTGLKSFINTRAIAYHEQSATQFADDPTRTNPFRWNCRPEKFEELRGYYIRKWGGNPREEKFIHPFNKDKTHIWEWEKNATIQ